MGFAYITGYPVVASTSVQARVLSTVIHINLAIVSFKAVDTDTGIATLGVMTSGTILAHVRPHSTFVHVLGTVASGIFCRTVTGVRSDPVDTTASILAEMAVTIVDIYVASGSGEALGTRAFVVIIVDLTTKATVFARVRCAGVIDALTMLASVALLTNTLIRSVSIPACASIAARISITLINVDSAVRPVEAVEAFAPKGMSGRDAHTILSTRVAGTMINLCTMSTFPAQGTSTSVVGQGL